MSQSWGKFVDWNQPNLVETRFFQSPSRKSKQKSPKFGRNQWLEINQIWQHCYISTRVGRNCTARNQPNWLQNIPGMVMWHHYWTKGFSGIQTQDRTSAEPRAQLNMVRLALSELHKLLDSCRWQWTGLLPRLGEGWQETCGVHVSGNKDWNLVAHTSRTYITVRIWDQSKWGRKTIHMYR